MMKQFSRYLAPALFGGVLMAGTWPAAAQDMDAVLERLQALLSEQTIDLDWEAAEIDGDSAVLRGVSAQGPEGEEIELGDIAISGVAEAPEGYRISEMTMESYVVGDDDMQMQIDGALLSGVLLPHEDADEAEAGLFFYETAQLTQLRAIVDGEEVFVLNGLNITVTPAVNGGPMSVTAVADRFEADLSGIEDEAASDVLQRLGYESLSGRLDAAGSWHPEDGRLRLERYDLTIDEGGVLGFAFDIGGYTREFVSSLNELQRSLADSDSGAAGTMAMMGLMQQLSLEGADIYFHDDSLTQRVLEMFAEDQGMRPQDVVNQAKAILPFMLAQIGAPQLGTMVADAVSNFLDDPQSIRISARPANGVPFALLMAGAMASPQALAEQIGLEVVANE